MPVSLQKTILLLHCPSRRAGLSLIEILMALFILTIAVLPAIGTFSGYYGVATRQMEQEMALKLGEAVVNVLMTANYSLLKDGAIPSLPLNIQTPSGSFAGTLTFAGSYASGTPVTIGKTRYIIGAEVKKIFLAQDITAPHNNALEFSWISPDAPPVPSAGAAPPPPPVATYSCFNDLICLKVTVDFGGAKPIELATFRADMAR
ncbi:MAG TPA: prepilin-type N-terminal cleavage/methylation domain-containing protein [Candidatus Ozemobacteraceae bacterium]|nr:prepilin-type N-terminal cleavage/methylation domain-containing protein [Candidatus Ozemobacteraceae bacterium]